MLQKYFKQNYMLAFIFSAVFIYYWPYTHQSFLIWDDEAVLSQYKLFHPVNWQNFIELWLQPFNGLYTPILKSIWSFLILIIQNTVGTDWAEKNVTLPFVALNILLHAANTLLVYKLALKLEAFIGKTQPSLIWVLGLSFYAFHPLQIENINWIMGTKELLWIHFALWCLLAFFGDALFKCLLFFIMSMLSKPTAIILIPLFLLLITLKKEKLLQPKNFFLLLPQLIIGVGLALWTSKIQPVQHHADLTQKILGAVDSFGFYVLKIIWPFPLSVDYGRNYTWLSAQDWTWAQAAFLTTLIAVIWILAKFSTQRKSLVLLSSLFFLPLVTTSGLIAVSFHTYSNVADHYASFSLIPCTYAVVLGLQIINKKFTNSIFAAYVILLAIIGWNYKSTWTDNKVLLDHILTVNNNSFMAHNNLGLVAAREGKIETAIKHFEESHRLNADFSQPLLNLFVLQTKARNFDYLKSLSADLDFDKLNDHQLYYEYANYLQASQQLAEAEDIYLKALALSPNQAQYHYRLAALYLAGGNVEKAKAHFQRAAELEPANKTYQSMFEQIQKLSQ